MCKQFSGKDSDSNGTKVVQKQFREGNCLVMAISYRSSRFTSTSAMQRRVYLLERWSDDKRVHFIQPDFKRVIPLIMAS
jgi:hypothetical protein